MNEENVAIRPVERAAQAAARAGEADLRVAEEQLAYAQVLDAGLQFQLSASVLPGRLVSY